MNELYSIFEFHRIAMCINASPLFITIVREKSDDNLSNVLCMVCVRTKNVISKLKTAFPLHSTNRWFSKSLATVPMVNEFTLKFGFSCNCISIKAKTAYAWFYIIFVCLFHLLRMHAPLFSYFSLTLFSGRRLKIKMNLNEFVAHYNIIVGLNEF